MKNKALLLSVLLLLFATSCVFTDANSPVGEPEPDDTYMGLRSSQIFLPPEVGDVESITIQSLRIIVFSKATGRVVTNKVFDISELSLTTKDPDTGDWIVDFSDIVVATKPGPSIVYVVLNENVFSVSGETLTGKLNMLSTITDMQTLVNTPLSYTHPLKVVYGTDGKPIEPPFIMSTFDEFDILPNRPYENPYIADLRGPAESNKGFSLDRTMAKVTLQSISSYPRYTGDVTDNVETSFIFILKVGLVNVPMQYLWSPNKPQTSTVPPVYTGAYQVIDFQLENDSTGYYDRTWNGSITATATANVVWRQYGKNNIYKILDNAGVNSYGTVPPNTPYQFDIGVQPNINNGNFLTYLQSYFSQGGGVIFDLGDITYSNTVITPVINGAYWELNAKNISYYVPEHILAEKNNSANATKLYVKASIASLPELNPDNVQFSQNDVNWVKDSQGNIIWTYPSSTELATLINNAFIREPVPGSTTKVYHVWDGSKFWREARGTVKVTLINPDFAHITDGNIKEFYLPIQNTPTAENPVDYNIYRNNEYKFSVHALRQWATTVSSVASAKSATALPEGNMIIQFDKE